MIRSVLLAVAGAFFIAQPYTANAESFSGTTKYRSTKKIIQGSLCGRAARLAIPPTLRISLNDLRFRPNQFAGTLGTINGVKMGGLGSNPDEFVLSASAPIPSKEGRCAAANTGGYFKRNIDGSLTVQVFQSVACNEGGASKRSYVCEDRKYLGRLIPRTQN